VSLLVVLVMAAALVWSFTYKLNEYAITPGLSQPVGPLITVSDHPRAPVRKTILLTDVYLTQLTIWQYLSDEVHPVHVQLVSGSELTGGNVPTSELTAQGYLEMYDSQNSAKVVSMRALGLTVTGKPAGVVVTAIAAQSPALAELHVADRIVAANGHVVGDTCGLSAALAGVQPDTSVPMDVERATISPSGTITYAAPTKVMVRTQPVPRGAAATGCPGVPSRTAWIGLALEDGTAWTFPVNVSIDTAYIGGPSAGLAMTLGVMDALSKVSITGGVKVAATGTIDPEGQVGPVGGVPEKTIAVETAGATLFLVPPANYGQAKSAASPSLKVVAVSTLDQALAAIRAVGGTTPKPIAEAALLRATS
jgi:Lon-like protease